MDILYFIIILGVLILIHEGGHFFFAKLFKVKVNEFALGMGPVIWKKQKGDTQYSLRAFPIGGYVKMEGEDEQSEEDGAFNKKKVYQKILIVIAGAIMNIVLGFIILVFIISLTSGDFNTSKVDKPLPEQTALVAGDIVTEIDNNRIISSLDIPFLIMRLNNDTTTVKVIRNNKEITISDFKLVDEDGTYILGFSPVVEGKNVITVLSNSGKLTISIVRMVGLSLLDLVTGRIGLEQASGPVGMTKAVGDAANSGVVALFSLIAFITINLGVFNLLPLPALDGGRLIFLLIEAVRGKPVKAEYEGYVHFAGFILLMLLMVLVTFNDIKHLFIK